MFTRQHPPDHRLLLAASNELEAPQLAAVRAHVAGCEECQQREARLQSALAAFTLHTNAVAVDDAADDSRARMRLRHAMRRSAQESAITWPWSIPAAVQSLQAPLALAVLIIGIGLSWATVTSRSLDSHQDVSSIDLPNGGLTPGAVSTLDAQALCSGERPSRAVPDGVREQVLAAYGMQGVAESTYELDALITPDLGGTATRANLWPQRYTATWNAHVKDALENLLATRVCRQEMPLAAAQQALAGDWVSAYKHYFDTTTPLAEHLASADTDQDLIVDGRTPATRKETWLPASLVLVSCPSCQP